MCGEGGETNQLVPLLRKNEFIVLMNVSLVSS